jgi:hypothetical protein
MRDATPETEAEIRKQVDREFARPRRRADLLLNTFRHAGLRGKQLTRGSAADAIAFFHSHTMTSDVRRNAAAVFSSRSRRDTP